MDSKLANDKEEDNVTYVDVKGMQVMDYYFRVIN